MKTYISTKTKTYISTKTIQAKPMTRGDYNLYRGWKIPDNEDPNENVYFIKRYDGYETWMSKETFENNYKGTEEILKEEGVEATNEFDFGFALEQLKQGKKVARSGWNGKGMYLFIAYGDDLSSCLFKEELTCCDSICMKTAQETIVVGWLASQTDMLAEDWEVVE